MEYKIGKSVRHAQTHAPLWVLRVGNEQVLCRTQDLREIWFYPHELEEMSEYHESRESRSSRFV